MFSDIYIEELIKKEELRRITPRNPPSPIPGAVRGRSDATYRGAIRGCGGAHGLGCATSCVCGRAPSAPLRGGDSPFGRSRPPPCTRAASSPAGRSRPPPRPRAATSPASRISPPHRPRAATTPASSPSNRTHLTPPHHAPPPPPTAE